MRAAQWTVLALASALLFGCGSPEPQPAEPTPTASAQPAVVATTAPAAVAKHAFLLAIERSVDSALGPAATGDAGTIPDFSALADAGVQLKEGADAVAADQPATLSETEAQDYGELTNKLRTSAEALDTAALAQAKRFAELEMASPPATDDDRRATLRSSLVSVRRSFHAVASTCVQCHTQFGSGR